MRGSKTEQEIWKDIQGYEGLYQVSSYGRVKSVKTNKILKPYIHNQGYLKISLFQKAKGKRYFVHRLVAIAFIPNTTNKPLIHHKDHNKTNNVPSNLEWCTYSENLKYEYDCGFRTSNNPFGEKSYNAKLSNRSVIEIKRLLRFGVKGAEIARKFKVSKSTISMIKKERIWRGII